MLLLGPMIFWSMPLWWMASAFQPPAPHPKVPVIEKKAP